MKFVVLAAGKGTRMLPLTKTMPKVMIHANKKPFLEYLINNIRKAGFDDITVVIGYKKNIITDYFGNSLNYVIQNEQKGTAHALSLLELKENFVLMMGDNLYSPRDLKNIAIDDDYCYVGCSHSRHPELFGVIEKKDDFIKKIIEKPKKPESDLVSIGLFKFTPEIFNAIKKIKLSERGEFEIPDAINILAEEKKVKLYTIEDYMINFGSLDDIKNAEEKLIKLGL